MNRHTIMGNLGADPESKVTDSGMVITTFRVATNDKWKDKDTKELKQRTEWHRVVTFGKLAETCRDYLSKGREIMAEVPSQTTSWTDKDNIKRYSTEIKALTVKFIGARPSNAGAKDDTEVPTGVYENDPELQLSK